MIQVKNIVKTYAGLVPTYALKGVTLEIKKGEFVALMGRSGSGKSTLLHQLGLIDEPTSGELYIDGMNIMSMTDDEKTKFRLEKLGYVFQEYALIAEFTTLENVAFPSQVLHGDFDYKKAKEILEIVGLGDRLDHYPRELSGGQQQRVAIARSLINSPKVLFADEATANLDTESSEIVLNLFKKLNKELGQTIVMITHEPDDKKYVDRVIWMKDGLLTQSEPSK